MNHLMSICGVVLIIFGALLAHVQVWKRRDFSVLDFCIGLGSMGVGTVTLLLALMQRFH